MMSRASRRSGMERTLNALESDFRRTLAEALQRCASGVWGLFGQNDSVLASLGGNWRERFASDAVNLIELGEKIESLRARLGLPRYEMYQRFLRYRQERGGSRQGEPALARQFLTEMADAM
jgi:hypothetical protein